MVMGFFPDFIDTIISFHKDTWCKLIVYLMHTTYLHNLFLHRTTYSGSLRTVIEAVHMTHHLQISGGQPIDSACLLNSSALPQLVSKLQIIYTSRPPVQPIRLSINQDGDQYAWAHAG